MRLESVCSKGCLVFNHNWIQSPRKTDLEGPTYLTLLSAFHIFPNVNEACQNNFVAWNGGGRAYDIPLCPTKKG